MAVDIYNFSDVLPLNISDSRPIKVFIKGQEQKQEDVKVPNRWTNVMRCICKYLNDNSETHDSFTNQFINSKEYTGDDVFKIKQKINNNIINKRYPEIDVSIGGANAKRLISLIKDTLKACSVNLQFFDVIYVQKGEEFSIPDIDILLATRKIQEYQKRIAYHISLSPKDTINIIQRLSQQTSTESSHNSFTQKDSNEISQVDNSNNTCKNNNLEIESAKDANISHNVLSSNLDGSQQDISDLSNEQIQNKEDKNEIQQENTITSISSEANSNGKIEGSKIEFIGSRYERDPQNRKDAIKLHKTTCFACGFNFMDMYGDFGKDFIEIHHINPLADQDSEVIINPQTDLIPLCANCHRMIHHRKPCLSLEELKELIEKNKINKK